MSNQAFPSGPVPESEEDWERYVHSRPAAEWDELEEAHKQYLARVQALWNPCVSMFEFDKDWNTPFG